MAGILELRMSFSKTLSQRLRMIIQIILTFILNVLMHIAKLSMTPPIVINVPTRALLAGDTKGSFVRWLANLNIKRNLTSMFVKKYLPY